MRRLRACSASTTHISVADRVRHSSSSRSGDAQIMLHIMPRFVCVWVWESASACMSVYVCVRVRWHARIINAALCVRVRPSASRTPHYTVPHTPERTFCATGMCNKYWLLPGWCDRAYVSRNYTRARGSANGVDGGRRRDLDTRHPLRCWLASERINCSFLCVCVLYVCCVRIGTDANRFKSSTLTAMCALASVRSCARESRGMRTDAACWFDI